MTTPSYESLTHSKWDCKYHIVFIPKGRKKALYGSVRKFLGPVFHELASQRGSTIIEGHMVQDHVHMLIKIPPKYSVAEVVGYIKGKSAIAVARQFIPFIKNNVHFGKEAAQIFVSGASDHCRMARRE
ncbi:MAG TPA: IS200/IS605 family transposase [Rhabdochlamydiaceae bacterium]|nr:IS200/IS605 family transposase [Rhabdochlamydiaceae bacterium]HSX38578.1 IS200/IS605 family transposase [Chlamydiales bacterium]